MSFCESLSSTLLIAAFHFQKSSIAMKSRHLPGLSLRGRVNLCLNIGALLLEITCPKYTKVLGRVERAWTVEPEDLCLDLMFATWYLYELGQIK